MLIAIATTVDIAAYTMPKCNSGRTSADRDTVQRRVTTTRRAMYRQLAPRANPVAPLLIARRDARLATLGTGCVYCGQVANTQDHLEPLVVDGMPTGLVATVLDILPCCASCNSSKGSSPWRVFMQRTKRRSRSHKKRITWLVCYDRWRRRHAQRWAVHVHRDRILCLNTLISDAHAYMQSTINRAVRSMHGCDAVVAHSRPLALDWSSINQQSRA